MNKKLLAIAVTFIYVCQPVMSSSPKTKALALAAHFRSTAEDFVDCVDELSGLNHSSKDVYDVQDARCADKRKKMARMASTDDERRLAGMLRDWYMQESTCKLIRELDNRGPDDYSDCLDAAEQMRQNAIRRGALRMK
jgi:hypothetical protein